MSAFMDDEAEVGSSSEDEQMDQNDQNSSDKKKKRVRAISSDESEDEEEDEEKAREEMKGKEFLVIFMTHVSTVQNLGKVSHRGTALKDLERLLS